MCSPPRSGSSSAPAAASAPKGTRIGFPRASSPGVARSISRTRFSAMSVGFRIGNHAALATLQPLADVGRQLLVCLGDGQLLDGVVRLGVRVQRLAYLLGAGEAAPQREVLPEGIAFRVGLPHEDPP